MEFIALHAKLQLPSLIVVDVMFVAVINRGGMLLPPYEPHHVGHSVAGMVSN